MLVLDQYFLLLVVQQTLRKEERLKVLVFNFNFDKSIQLTPFRMPVVSNRKEHINSKKRKGIKLGKSHLLGPIPN